MKDYESEQPKHKSGRNYRVSLWRTNKTSLYDGKFYETRITWLQPCEVQRGLYQSKNGIMINADVNGAANIGRKCKQNFTFEELSSGFLASPKRIRVA